MVNVERLRYNHLRDGWASLGIFNFVQGLRQRRVRIKVIPKLAVYEGGRIVFSEKRALGRGIPAIEVINLSSFPVTVAEAGFTLKGEGSRVKVGPVALDGKPLARRLESRESVTVCFSPDDAFPKTLHRAYATTACNKKQYGDSPALQKFRAQLQEEAHECGRIHPFQATPRAGGTGCGAALRVSAFGESG